MELSNSDGDKLLAFVTENVRELEMCKHLTSCFFGLGQRFRDLTSVMCPGVSSLSLYFA